MPDSQKHTAGYLTIASSVDAEITVQRSRFIASLRRADCRDDFDAAMKDIIAAYPKATHYCWAYRFHAHTVLEHASDAGEPAGTAGRPILGSLKKFSLLNIMAVVTRYYGGIKLGVKGLIAAYGETTIYAIEKASIIMDEPRLILYFKCKYDIYNILLSRLERILPDMSSLDAEFSDVVTGRLPVPISAMSTLKAELDAISAGGSALNYEIREK
ncbi:MAG: IMPACT family protein [Synergistaceae bacterium]|nr:IMPACT family protein [Synergistaceae bacterium]